MLKLILILLAVLAVLLAFPTFILYHYLNSWLATAVRVFSRCFLMKFRFWLRQ